MKRSSLSLGVYILIPVLILSCSGRVIRGSGPEKTEQRSVNMSGVSELDISAPVDAKVYFDGESSVTLKGPSDVLACIKTRVKGHSLYIETQEGMDINISKSVQAELHLPAINSLDVSGAGKVSLLTPFKADHFSLGMSGAGTIVIDRIEANSFDADLSGAADLKLNAGIVEKASYELSGSGNIDAMNVEHRSAKVDISGAADASLNVSEVLDAEISGAGSIRYKGRPKINQDVSGAGRLVSVD